MAKIGRNEPCPCGSGLKYKKCCLGKEAEETELKDESENETVEESAEETLEESKTVHGAVDKIKEAAQEKKRLVMTSGVLILFSTEEGDAWLLETTEQDALQLMNQGKELDVLIEENPETTTVEWSHTFKLKKKLFIVTSYKEKDQQIYEEYPVKKIIAAMKGIKKRIPAAWAGMVHVPLKEGEEPGNQDDATE